MRAFVIAIAIVVAASPRAFADARYVVRGTIASPTEGVSIAMSIDGGPELACEGNAAPGTLCAVTSSIANAAAYTIIVSAPGYERYRKNIVTARPTVEGNRATFLADVAAIRLTVTDLPSIEKIVRARSQRAIRFSVFVRNIGAQELLVDSIRIQAHTPGRAGPRPGGPGGCLEQTADVVYELADSITLQVDSATGDTAALESQVMVNGREYAVKATGRFTSNDCNGAQRVMLRFDTALKLPPASLTRADLIVPESVKFESSYRGRRLDDKNHALAQTGEVTPRVQAYSFHFHTTANHRFEAAEPAP